MVRPPKSVNAAALSRVVMDAPRNAGTSSTTADTVSVTNMSSREIGMRPSPIRDTAVAGESYPTIDALPGAILTELHGIREVLERRSRPRDADDLRVGRLLALHVGSKRLAACDVTALAREAPYLRDALALADADDARSLGKLLRTSRRA